MSNPPGQPKRAPTQARRGTNRRVRCGAAAVVLVGVFAACAAHSPSPSGTFIEEFEGFPIYHGEPDRPYEVIGTVYNPEAAARGVSPMKRASVAEARRRGADAIVVGVVFDGPGARAPHQSDSTEPPAARNKWELAVAVAWR
jgi:hypothetical protein